MKKFLPPLLVLGGILAFALWNSAAMDSCTSRWQDQLLQAYALARAGDWDAAASALAESYADWSGSQTYLHIVTEHDAVDDAEAMYRRAKAFAGAREPSEFQAELADLMDQLRLLAEMETGSIRNIL